MTHKLTYLKDVVGNNYVGINIPNEDVQPHLEKLKEILGEEDFEIFTQNQKMKCKKRNPRFLGGFSLTLVAKFLNLAGH